MILVQSVFGILIKKPFNLRTFKSSTILQRYKLMSGKNESLLPPDLKSDKLTTSASDISIKVSFI